MEAFVVTQQQVRGTSDAEAIVAEVSCGAWKGAELDRWLKLKHDLIRTKGWQGWICMR